MKDLIPKTTDEELERYYEAEATLRARIPMEGNAALKFEADPITGRENAYFPLSAGGYVKIGDRAVTPEQAAETDVLAAEREIQNDARGPISEVMGGADGPKMDDYLTAGFTEADVREYLAQEQARMLAQPGTQVKVQLTPEQVQMGVDVGAPMLAKGETDLRDRVQSSIFNAMSATEEPKGPVGEAVRSMLQGITGSELIDPSDLRFWSNYLTDVVDITVPGVGGALSLDDGARIVQQGYQTGNAVDMLIGGLVFGMGALELVPMVKNLTRPARQALAENLSPAAKNLLADTVGASRAIAQGDREMLMEIFQPAGTPRSLGAAAPEGAILFGEPRVRPLGERSIELSSRLTAPREGAAANISLAPPSEEPMVGQLAPEYRVRVEGFTPVGTGRQSFIPRKLTPNNSQTTIARMSELAQEYPDPLSSPESYAGMMARVRNEAEVPAPPSWMIENANNMEEWSSWFSGLTPDQIRAADEGLAVQNDFRNAYQGGAGPELTGQLMLWSILSRTLSAFPHESGFLELAENATPFIQRAARGEWTDADTQAWLEMVPATIPLDSPGRSATSNANAFGETFLRKMAATDENGRSALLRLHEMIADPNMSSADIRRQYYGLAEDTGIANKILSFALLVSGRNDVVVLDRIQINRMWAGGDKVYDDIMGQFEGAQGLAQYEALERSLAPRIDEVYRMAGREGEGSVGRYHWESWVLSSGQVVSHPTLGSVVRAGQMTPEATTRAPVMEGRFHRWNYGVRYEKMPEGGNRYVYETSTGEPFQFTKAELDAMFKDVQKRSSGVLPPSFPGVSSFEGGNIPWYQYEGVNRERLDEIIRQSGKPVTE